MVIMKEIAQRLAGMGYKVMKFHAILHMAMDMLLFGPPMEIDTGSNEEHHKDAKDAAQLTQKNRDQFNWQTSVHLAECQVIDLAVQELNGKAMWEYLEEHESDLDEEEDDDLLPDMSTIDDPEVTDLGPEAKNEDNNIEIETGVHGHRSGVMLSLTNLASRLVQRESMPMKQNLKSALWTSYWT